MLKKFSSVILLALIILSLLPISVFADGSVITTDSCGENVTYTLYNDGKLVISGAGDMYNYSNENANSPFYYNESITSVYVNKGVTSVGKDAFYTCPNLQKVVISDGVKSIGDGAFADCLKLKNITIPSSVESIGSEVFRYQRSLESITVDENNAYYTSDEYGVLYNKNKTVLIHCPAKISVSEYTIPDSVTHIDVAAFQYCNFESIIIPNNVKIIGGEAFFYCENLENVTIGNSVELIDWSAFYACYKIKSITIPASVKRIESMAFGDIGGVSQNFVVYGYSGTCAETYATQNGIQFLSIDLCKHEYTNGVWKPYELEYDHYIDCDNCGSAGRITRFCSDGDTKNCICDTCGRHLPHDFYQAPWTVDIAPTCTQVGYKSQHCLNCFEMRANQKEIPATGHSFGAWVISKNPTYTSEGIESRKCVNCDATETREIARFNDTDNFVLGDINGDGVITAEDSRYILRKAADLIEFTQEQFYCADVNKDGAITADDARIVLRITAQLDKIENYL